MSCDLEVTNENGAGKYLDSWKIKINCFPWAKSLSDL